MTRGPTLARLGARASFCFRHQVAFRTPERYDRSLSSLDREPPALVQRLEQVVGGVLGATEITVVQLGDEGPALLQGVAVISHDEVDLGSLDVTHKIVGSKS